MLKIYYGLPRGRRVVLGLCEFMACAARTGTVAVSQASTVLTYRLSGLSMCACFRIMLSSLSR